MTETLETKPCFVNQLRAGQSRPGAVQARLPAADLLYRKPLVYVRMHCLRADAARDTSHRNKRMLDMFRT